MRNKKTESKVTLLKDFEPGLIRKVVTPLETQEGNEVFWKDEEFGFRQAELAAEVRIYLREISTLPVDLRCIT